MSTVFPPQSTTRAMLIRYAMPPAAAAAFRGCAREVKVRARCYATVHAAFMPPLRHAARRDIWRKMLRAMADDGQLLMRASRVTSTSIPPNDNITRDGAPGADA